VRYERVAQEQSAAWCEESDGKEEGGRRQTLSAHRGGDTAKAENIWQHKDVRDEESQQEKIDCEEDSKIGAAEQVAVGIEIGAAGDAGAGIGGHWEERKGENHQAAASETAGRGRQAMFLYTDDAWSLRYFDPNDLHFKEREVFG